MIGPVRLGDKVTALGPSSRTNWPTIDGGRSIQTIGGSKEARIGHGCLIVRVLCFQNRAVDHLPDYLFDREPFGFGYLLEALDGCLIKDVFEIESAIWSEGFVHGANALIDQSGRGFKATASSNFLFLWRVAYLKQREVSPSAPRSPRRAFRYFIEPLK
jgi:hypothetical protein